MEPTFELAGRNVPRLVYGTAWKEERTASLVEQALAAGFRAIDTANQRKHYFEAGVGEALAKCGVPRADLFIQTKFTYQRGQDRRLPYDPEAALQMQVEQSLESSLEHLGTTYVDSLVLHGPERATGWSAADREAWSAMEGLQRRGKARLLGVSNIEIGQLQALCRQASVQPAIVQNRCYARTGWDRELRALCRERSIAYQGFSLLTANREELDDARVASLAARLGATIPQLVFRFAMALGMMPLTGTSNRRHMDEDLAARAVALEPKDVSLIEKIGG